MRGIGRGEWGVEGEVKRGVPLDMNGEGKRG